MQFSGEERVGSGTPGAGLNPWRNERFIDVGNYWLENILWPIYKRTMKEKYQQMSNRLNQCLVNITTVSSEDGISFIYGNIYALVKVGFYTTVWWKFTPCGIDIPPEDPLPISCDFFFNDKAIVPGYTKITLQETKDISDIVMSALDDTPFHFDDTPLNEMPRMQDPAEANIERKWRVGGYHDRFLFFYWYIS